MHEVGFVSVSRRAVYFGNLPCYVIDDRKGNKRENKKTEG